MNNVRFGISKSVFTVALGAFSFAAFGEGTYFFKGTQADSITTASLWEDAQGQSQAAISAEADYVIPADTSARFTTSSFAGRSLTVGDNAGAGTLLGKYYAGFTTFNNLILANGYLKPLYDGGASDKRARIDGRITVTAPAATPFVVRPNNNSNGIGFALKADIAGAAGTGLELLGSGRYQDTITLSGDNAGYLGDLVIASSGVSSGYADWQLFVDSPTALGGALPASKADAVTLDITSSATLTLTKNAGPRIAAANRGIVLTGDNPGGLAIEVESDADVELALPISGTGSVRKTGAGRLTLSGDFTASGTIACEAGALVLASGSALAKAGTVGGAVSVRVPTCGISAAGVSFDAARLTFAQEGAQFGTLVMAGTCSLSGRTTLAFESAADLSGLPDGGVLLVKIPTAVKTVTADDFAVDYPAARCGLPRIQVVVSDLGDDLQGVSVRRLFPVVTRADGDPTASQATFATAKDANNVNIWDNGLAVQSGSDYLLTADRSIRSTAQFAGESLTLEGGSTLILKQVVQTIGLLVAYPGSRINNGNPSTGKQCELAGRLVVCGTWDNPASVNDHSSTAGIVLSTSLEGDGVLALRRNTGSLLHVTLQGENAAFTGSIVAGTTPHSLVLTVASPAVLGGAPDAFNYRSLVLENAVTLVPAATMTLATDNRGVCIRGNVTVSTEAGVTLTVNEPVTYNGVLTKSGAGRLVLGARAWFENSTGDGVVETPVADMNRLVLDAGEVVVADNAAVSNVVLVAGEGAIRLGPSSASDRLGAIPAGIDVTSANLVVTAADVSDDGKALFTVDAAIADALNGKVRLYTAGVPARKLTLEVRNAADGSGRKTFFAVRKGLVLVFR